MPRCGSFVLALLEQHRKALEIGVTGMPAARLEGMDSAIVGALPIEM